MNELFFKIFFRYLMPSLFNQQKQNPKAILPWGILERYHIVILITV